MLTHAEPKRRAYLITTTAFSLWLVFLAVMTWLGTVVEFDDQPRYLLLLNLISDVLVGIVS